MTGGGGSPKWYEEREGFSEASSSRDQAPHTAPYGMQSLTDTPKNLNNLPMQREHTMAPQVSSSPDPLNDSPTYHSLTKPRRSGRVSHTFPLRGSSPKKQTFQLDVGNQLSPQKIRVTVEAEGSDVENYINVDQGPSSPTRKLANRRRERTTTTTIPVKGLSDSEEEVQETTSPKKGRGRPRKSAVTPVPAKKRGRASTPTQKSHGRRKSIGSLVDGDDSADISFQIGQGVEIGRGKGRSQSRSTKGTIRKSTPAAKPSDAADKNAPSVTSKGRGRRKTLFPEDLAVLEDISSGSTNGATNDAEDGVLEPANSNRGYAPSTQSTIRSATTVDEDVPDVLLARFHPGNETPRETGWSSPRFVEAPIPSSSRQRNNGYPSPSISPDKSTFPENEESVAFVPVPPSDAAQLSTVQGSEDEYEGEAEDDVGDMREFDTILESEEFSMISVDSVPSLREHLSSPPNQGEKEPASAQPTRFVNQSLLSLQQARMDDSFSSLPPDVIKAATPGKKTLAAKLSSRQSSKNSLIDNSVSSIAPEILKAATPAKPSANNGPSAVNSTFNDYEDDFSFLPTAVLEAATPAAVRQAREAREVKDRLNVPNLNFRPGSSQSAGSSASRLLTPDETPSPPIEGSSSKNQSLLQSKQPSAPQSQENNTSFINYSQIRSSPPSLAPQRFTYTAHLRQRRELNLDTTQTPSIVFSSPTLPPRLPRNQAALAPLAAESSRPVLSPILRAGQVLQDIMVPSSPRSRSQSLGSPFKSPVAERKSSPMILQPSNLSPTNERRAGPLPRLDLNSQLSGRNSERYQDEDPFSTKAQGPSPEQKQRYSLDLPHNRRYSDPRLDQLRSFGDTIRSDDAMSWQAEEEVSVPEPSASVRANTSAQRSSPRPTLEETWEAERAAVRKQAAAAQNVVVIDSDDERSRIEQEEGDEDFGLLLETLNSSSPAVRRQEPAREIGERPRRSKIPSPWRKNSKRLVYSDELSQIQDALKEARPEPITVRRVAPATISDSIDDADMSGWQIPQKSNFQPRVRENTNLDLSALLTASPLKKLPTLTGSSSGASRPQSSSGKPTLLAGHQVEQVQKDNSRPSGFTPIAQKAGFNPRPRADSSSPVKPASFLPSMFGGPSLANEHSSSSSQPRSTSSAAPAPLSSSSPSKTNALPAHHAASVPFSPSISEDDSMGSISSNPNNKENLSTNTRTQEWASSLKLSTTPFITPARPSSPSKSCLRSPLKTPSAQHSSSEQSPSKGVTFVSSSPLPTSPAPLSGIVWSKAHWSLLDSILQSWKPENNPSPGTSSSGEEILDRRGSYQFENGQPRLRRRNSTRVISKLLGKNVSADGEKMRLDQWHLEVVDEFRGVVPGWEEKVVAMRVFAALVGERKRAERERIEREREERGVGWV